MWLSRAEYRSRLQGRHDRGQGRAKDAISPVPTDSATGTAPESRRAAARSQGDRTGGKRACPRIEPGLREALGRPRGQQETTHRIRIGDPDVVLRRRTPRWRSQRAGNPCSKWCRMALGSVGADHALAFPYNLSLATYALVETKKPRLLSLLHHGNGRRWGARLDWAFAAGGDTSVSSAAANFGDVGGPGLVKSTHTTSTWCPLGPLVTSVAKGANGVCGVLGAPGAGVVAVVERAAASSSSDDREDRLVGPQAAGFLLTFIDKINMDSSIIENNVTAPGAFGTPGAGAGVVVKQDTPASLSDDCGARLVDHQARGALTATGEGRGSNTPPEAVPGLSGPARPMTGGAPMEQTKNNFETNVPQSRHTEKRIPARTKLSQADLRQSNGC
ncbi:hypothetical protein WN55_01825 [Dufourea novaeangliae]|uniref:Uncharacterized protein n=1 Tax=Dufourea novaeangliae TaxID=178035 RepID=A0A154PG20_DUFNO|nr:hypothetical protein WN55_01825 [Dufourea novaeangliae]